MDKTTPLRVAAAISALVALPVAAAAPLSAPAVPQAQSYAELLDPIPNAAERLRVADSQDPAPARLIEAQYYPPVVAHHHHHHHHHWRRHRRHYHHHHHNNY